MTQKVCVNYIYMDTLMVNKKLTKLQETLFWVSVILCGIIGFGLLTNLKEDEQDLSFLKPDNLLSTITEKEVILPAFTIKKMDKIEQLAYDAAIIKYPSYSEEGNHGLCIVAPKIYGTSEEGNKLRIFVTVYYESYRFYGNRLVEDSGGIVPVAITYVKDSEGNYSLEEYLESGDGSMWVSSIEAFCVTPISGKKIKGLAEKIIEGYSDYSELFKIEKENLKNYLKTNQLSDVKVFDVLGNVKNIN